MMTYGEAVVLSLVVVGVVVVIFILGGVLWSYLGKSPTTVCAPPYIPLPPKPKALAECEESVIEKIRARRDMGRKKYGTTMERTDLSTRQWLIHAQEEAMDLAIYLERLIKEME